MPERQHVQFERMVQAPLVRSAGCTIAQPHAAQLGQQREEATCLRQAERLPVRGTQTGGGQVAANLPVRRSGSEGGKEIGYGG